ncbi:nucleotide exchange factor GrpE [Guyparkeria halophila]|uniref:Protein GrpE n=1 Tax=Guyparkeria halophila TaxID=47960 RepID=A0ABZ0YYB6_9GAMM|nr:nucleotide exchange factor GrpE [Guyparkeria halophila]WQH17031.1 nucleotide exchange factor GrpE [Guyparkeria halophila]
MTDKPVDHDDMNQEQPEQNVEDGDQAQAGDAGEQGELGEVEQLQAQLAEKDEELLRIAAEMQNVRHRAERDIESARKFALERFVEGLLPVVDSLELGIQAAENENATLEKIKEGDEMTLKMLIQTLEKFGVQAVHPIGERFNPEHHQAISLQPHDGEPDHVVDVMQKGYLLKDRVVRPAMVVVSKPE